MRWLELVENPQPISVIFRNIEPVLIGVQLHEVVLHHDGPRMILRFDLREYPENPPKKWREAVYNRVQVRLMLIALYQVHLDGWSTSNVGDIAIERLQEGSILLKLTSPECVLKVVCGSVRLDRVSAYRDSDI